jgi:hypothetical protein
MEIVVGVLIWMRRLRYGGEFELGPCIGLGYIISSVGQKILEKFPVGNIVNFHSDQ